MNLTLQLTLQEDGSEAEDDDDTPDFTELGYHLRDKLMPPTLTAEQSQQMTSLKKAKTLQTLLDEQIKNLASSKRMKKVLERTVQDAIPCPIEHRIHFRRVLEILIADMNISCRVQEKTVGSCIAFRIFAATVPPGVLTSTPTQPRSQLNFSPGMLEVNVVS